MSRLQLFILCICAHFTVTFCVTAPFYPKSNETTHFYPAYAIATRADLLSNSTECSRELQDFRDGVDRRVLWSLKILDSSGKPTSGFLYGNNFWLGVPSQCLDTTNKVPLPISEKALLNNTLYRDPEKEFPPFQVNYFVAYFRHNSTLQYQTKLNSNEDLITLGLCLPASCSVNDITFVLEMIFRDRLLQIGDLYFMDFRLIKVKNLKDDHHWLLTDAPIICIVLLLTVSIMILGTIYDIFVHQNFFTCKTETSGMQNVGQEIPIFSVHRKSTIGEILRCFSAYTNTKVIFNTKSTSNTVSVIHGLRVLSMIWIITDHVAMIFSIDYFDNKAWAAKLTDGFFIQILSNGSLAVDTFFLISGFLLTYMYLRNSDEKREKLFTFRAKLSEFFDLMIKRFTRLTPAYMMTIGIVQLTSSWYDKTSIFYTRADLHEICAKYWWTYLLYINNLYDISTKCTSWTWYLASDTQFYVIGVILLILSTVYFYWTIVILGALLIGSTIISGYISYVYEYVPTLDETLRLSNVIYFPSWVRIGPYIIGMLTGFLIMRLNKILVLKKRTVILCWCVGSTCTLLVLFGIYKRHISVLSSAVYTALSRTVWATGIAWILVACITKNGGFINHLLSLRCWIPLSRLTYCAYLINPVIIQSISFSSESSVHFDPASELIAIFGYSAVSYVCAYVLFLMAEIPYILLTQMVFKYLRRREQKPQEIVIAQTKL